MAQQTTSSTFLQRSESDNDLEKKLCSDSLNAEVSDMRASKRNILNRISLSAPDEILGYAKNSDDENRGLTLEINSLSNDMYVGKELRSNRGKPGIAAPFLSLVDCDFSKDPLSFPDPPLINDLEISRHCTKGNNASSKISSNHKKNKVKRRDSIRLSLSSSRRNVNLLENNAQHNCNSIIKSYDHLHESNNKCSKSNNRPPRGSVVDKLADADFNLTSSDQKLIHSNIMSLSGPPDEPNGNGTQGVCQINDENDERILNRSDTKDEMKRGNFVPEKYRRNEVKKIASKTSTMLLEKLQSNISQRRRVLKPSEDDKDMHGVNPNDLKNEEKMPEIDLNPIKKKTLMTVASAVRDEIEVTLQKPEKGYENGTLESDANLIQQVRQYCRIPPNERLESNEGHVLAGKILSHSLYPLHSIRQLKEKDSCQKFLRQTTEEKRNVYNRLKSSFYIMESLRKADSHKRQIFTGVTSKRLLGNGYSYHDSNTGQEISPRAYAAIYLKSIHGKPTTKVTSASDELQNGFLSPTCIYQNENENYENESYYDCCVNLNVVCPDSSNLEKMDRNFSGNSIKEEPSSFKSKAEGQDPLGFKSRKIAQNYQPELNLQRNIERSRKNHSNLLTNSEIPAHDTNLSSFLTPKTKQMLMKKPLALSCPDEELAAAEERLHNAINNAMSKYSEEVSLLRLARHTSEENIERNNICSKDLKDKDSLKLPT